MRLVVRCFLLRFSLLVLAITISARASAQTAQTTPSKNPGTIAGRVTAGSQPAAGVEVLVKPGGTAPGMDLMQFAPATTATTDSDGRYRLTNLAPGSYRLTAYAPAYVIEGGNDPLYPGRAVNVGEGEVIENVNISLRLGGVLTGKVTDPDDRPVIGEMVSAHRLSANEKSFSPGLPDFFNLWQTDDRGIYRIFGLEPGKYTIAAGTPSEGAMVQMSTAGGTYYRRTFHINAIEERNARIIEIKSGDEIENVDIKLERASTGKTFAATGRVVEAENGKPVIGVMIAYSPTKQGAQGLGLGNSLTNSQGEFRLEGLTPSTYRAYVMGLEASELYGEQIEFEISGSDLTGLEIKMRQGVSISGVAVIEGSTDPALREKLSKIQLFAVRSESIDSSDFLSSFPGVGQISPNGTFRIGGVRPGKIRLGANTMMVEGISLLRIEHNGAEVKELQLNTAGDRATGVRVVFAYGMGSISGRVEIRGGTLPSNIRLGVIASRNAQTGVDFDFKMADLDARGQFLIEGLTQGTYKLTLTARGTATNKPDLPTIEQTVIVQGNTRQDVTLVVDLSKKEEK
jgi:protocatechuate 3,4-dioxygenase beta subunit